MKRCNQKITEGLNLEYLNAMQFTHKKNFTASQGFCTLRTRKMWNKSRLYCSFYLRNVDKKD